LKATQERPHTAGRQCAPLKSAVGRTRPVASFAKPGYPLPWILHEMFSECDASANGEQSSAVQGRRGLAPPFRSRRLRTLEGGALRRL